MNIRGRLRVVGIRCIPWRLWKGEIELLPISAQTLFKRDGVPIDALETELESEGFLFPEESLLELIKTDSGLKREPLETEYQSDMGGFPDDWTEEDFKVNGY